MDLMNDYSNVFTRDEKEAIQRVTDTLVKLCNEKLIELMEDEEMGDIVRFNLSVVGLSIEFACDASVYEELMKRLKEEQERNVTYYG